MKMTIRHYAVMYPSVEMANINRAIAVQECPVESEVLRMLEQWRARYPGRRCVYRRELEPITEAQ